VDVKSTSDYSPVIEKHRSRSMRMNRHTLRRSTLALALLLGGMLGDAAAQGRDRGEPGRFDYYVLSLSWSPSFCETSTRASEQCGARPYSFVVHGLWPQYERGFPENCQVPPPRLDHRVMSAMLDLMPAPGLVYHEWNAHGTCSGLAQRAYFDLVRQARAVVKIPPQFTNPQQAINVTGSEVVDAFVKANPGLSSTGVSIDCDRSRLREVRICLTKDLKFRTCGGSRDRACATNTLRMPPVRGG
jgi:ribonuclease T2